MNARERLEGYLQALRHRLRLRIFAQAGAIAASGVLILTGSAVWLLAREDFSPAVAISGRVVLILFLALVIALLLWLPLRRLAREDGARVFEQRLPDENGRIQTYLDSKRREANGIVSPLTDLLAADAAKIAEKTAPAEIVSSRNTAMGAALAVAAVAALALLLLAGPAYWGFGSRHLLLGAELPREAVPVRRIVVTPGDATVRRNSDLSIRAAVEGFQPEQAQVYVRFADRQEWERAPMRAAGDSKDGKFEFRLYAVRGPLQYYVDAEGTRSPDHSVGVADLPRIERVRLTYSYPEWTGLSTQTDEESRDIRAVAGTDVKVEVFADAPLEAPALIVDGQPSELRQEGQASTGNIAVSRPGSYRIGARVADEFVALSEDYAIEIVADEKPAIEIRKPGRDWRATSIEEVPVRVQAEDDFRLREVALRYSVNGGEWRTLPVGGGTKQADSESLLRLEELGALTKEAEKRLAPGDLVSYYAVARDRRQSVETDLFMVQVQPFERTFKQAQSGGGGGGNMADEQGAISERQREILLATWNLQRSDERNARSRQQLEDSAKMLAELQTTLAQQARTLAQRTRARSIVEEDERVKTFVESLERAAGLMDPAAGHLSAFRLKDAVPPEQQALQQLLRAEAAFREVQVSMQQNGSGSEGSQAARNFTEMFELEMDLEKSQYESESQMSRRNQQQEIDEAIRKLKELAERQEKLAQEQNRSAQQLQEQRWKQEQLRREAEDLRRRLAELNRQQQGEQQNQQSASRSGDQSSQGGSQGSSSSEESGSERSARAGEREQERKEIERALESVNKALEDMKAANDAASDEASGTQSARDASRNLRQALRQMEQPDPSKLDEALHGFANRTERLVEDQQRVENDLYSALSESGASQPRFGSRGGMDPRRMQQLVESKQQMANDLANLQSDMRSAVHEHRTKTPKSTQRLSEIVRDIEGSDVMYRLNRSAAEIYYGRARDAAPREGLITEALETLEQDLREAASLAERERNDRRDPATVQDLLAEVAQLRRSLQEQEGQRGASDEQRNGRSEGQRGNAPGQSPSDAQDAQRDSAQAATRESGRSQSQRSGGQQRSTSGGSEGADDALAAWDPIVPPGALGPIEDGSGSLSRQAATTGQRIRDLINRIDRGQLTQAEIDALRRSAHQLRRLSGDPMAEHGEAMRRAIDQIELTALTAASRARERTAAHATLPSPDSPRYREAVAEYYRRLGNK